MAKSMKLFILQRLFSYELLSKMLTIGFKEPVVEEHLLSNFVISFLIQCLLLWVKLRIIEIKISIVLNHLHFLFLLKLY
jgi:hypothetical protein